MVGWDTCMCTNTLPPQRGARPVDDRPHQESAARGWGLAFLTSTRARACTHGRAINSVGGGGGLEA